MDELHVCIFVWYGADAEDHDIFRCAECGALPPVLDEYRLRRPAPEEAEGNA